METRGFMKDMNRADLLKMRDGGMGNAAIAVSVGCSVKTIYDLIGPQPPEITKRNRREGMARASESRWSKTSVGGYTVERKMKSFMPPREELEEQKKAVLVVKPMKTPIPLHGEYMDYVISADRDLIDVDTSEGRTLMQIQMDKLDLFIAELTAIKNNAGIDKPMKVQFWG